MSALFGTGERAYCNKCQNWRPSTDFSTYAVGQHKIGDENAMCLDCIDILEKRRLCKDEIAGFIKEDRERLISPTRNAEYEEMTGVGRLGKVRHHSEVIPKIQKLVPNLAIRPGNIAGSLSLYRVLNEQADFICWMREGLSPEFSIVEFNKQKQPINEIRGWRTVLLRLIKFGLLTEKQVENHFGRPSSPQQARFWDKQLYFLRNERITSKD